ncbi:MAG: cadherin-like beta sandwich domain-containing protein [Gammaproteobacteria bacterium]|nr:cadherin-like beta sandwich domain-containing protein [Gammaproteobacteria bacterium]
MARGCASALFAAAVLLAAPANAQTTTEVPSNWALIPSGLGEGDEFRLMFMTKNGLEADSTDIAVYDAEVRSGIDRSGHADIRDAEYRDTFKVLASTASVNARHHTGTTGSGGVPIYWLNGTKVADSYGDFYDGSWDDKGGATLQDGGAISQNRRDQFLCTGTDDNGTTTSQPMGASTCSGTMIETTSNTLSGETGASTARSRYLALSGVFRVGAAAGDTIPVVESLAITSDPGTDEEYVSGDSIKTTVTFSEAVSVTGTPRLKLKFDDKRVVRADYASGDSTDTRLVFSYTVKPSDYAHKGIVLPKNGINLSGGTIKNQAGTMDAHLDFKKQAKDKTQRVYILPTVASVALASTPAADNTYRSGETIKIDLTFDRDVLVVTDGGTPSLDINVGTHRSRSATYTTTNGDFDVRFEYVVQPGDLDEIGLSIANNAIVFNGGRIIRKGHGNSVSAGEVNIHLNGGSTGIVAQPGHLVDATDALDSTKVTLAANKTSVGESDGATTVRVTGTPNYAARTADTSVTVSVGASGDAAEEGTDYASVNDFTLTISEGQKSGSATFTLTPTADEVDEEDESITIAGTVTGLTVDGTTLAIEDDDTRGVSVSARTLSVDEGGDATYTVVLDSQPTGTVTVTPSASGDADVTASPAALTFTASNWATAQTVTVSAAHDDDVNSDRARVSHAVSGADYGSATARGVAVTVDDDDSDATLKALTLTDGNGNRIFLSPETFDPATTSYAASVAHGVDTVTLGATANDPQASTSIVGDDDANTPGTANLDLAVGANTLTVTVTGANGTDTETYTVTVTRAAATALGQVTGVSLTPGFKQMEVSWNAVTGADGYRVQWKSGAETFAGAAGDDREATVSSASTTSHTITDLASGVAYSVWVVATKTGSSDGTPSTAATATTPTPARVESVEFTNVPSSGFYDIGDTIEISIGFDKAVEVTGSPRVRMDFAQLHIEVKFAAYDSAASSETVLVFKYPVTGADDEDTLGVRVSPNALQLRGGTIRNEGTSIDARTRFGNNIGANGLVLGPNIVTRWIENIEVASTPSVPETVRGVPIYGPGEEIRFRVAWKNAVDVDVANGTPQLKFQSGNNATVHNAAYESGSGTKELLFAWTVPADVAGDGARLVLQSNTAERSDDILANRGLALNGGEINSAGGIAVNHRHDRYRLNTQVDTTAPSLAAGSDGATVDGATLVLSFQNPKNGDSPDHLDENSTPAPADFAVSVAGSARDVSSVSVSGASVTLTLASAAGQGQTVTVGYAPGTNKIRDRWGNDAASITDRNVRNDTPETASTERVTGLGADATARSVKLSWTAPSGAIVGYGIEVSYDDGGVWAEVEGNTNDTGTAFSHRSGLTSGETRHYRVTAITDQGAGPPSVAVAANATQIVAGLTATGEAVEDTPEGSAAINLCWDGPGVTLTDMSDFSIRKRMDHPSFLGRWEREGWISLGVFEFGDCEEGVVGYRVRGNIAANVPYAFQFRARKGTGWALSNVAEGVSVDSALELRADVVAGDSELSGDTIVPDNVCRDYDDPATPEDEEGAFIVNIGFTTFSPAILFYEEVSGFVPDDDLTLENATAELIDRPYDIALGYRVRITPTNWGQSVAVSVPAGAVTHPVSSVSNQASNVFRRDTSDSTECAVGSSSDVYRARVKGAEIREDRDRSGEWSRGERVRATLTFEERVAVTTDGGVPSVSLDIDGETVQASYVRGTGSETLEFEHVVTQAQSPVREAELLEDSLALNGGAIASLYGPAVELAHPGATNASRMSRSATGPMRFVTVADAEAQEAVGAELAFAVKLDGPAPYGATVDYKTSDATATAGDDYTATSGTLSFAAGETSKTVYVPVLDDVHDEGSETLKLTLHNPQGVVVADGEAVGTIANTDAMPRAWLARFGRTVADQVLDAVDMRMTTPAVPGTQAMLAGRPIGGAAEERTAVDAHEAQARLGALTEWFDGVEEDADGERAFRSRAATGRELLEGTSFAFTAGTAETGFGGVWASGAVSRFDGREGALALDGEVASTMLGADYTRGRGTLGVVLSNSRGEGAYRSPHRGGKVESRLRGVYPWARYALSERVSAWSVVGYGAGSLTLTPEGLAPVETDMDLAMAALGGRGVLAQAPAAGGFEVAAKTDALVVRTTSDEVRGGAGSLAATEADVTRLRLGLEGTWHGLGGRGSAFVPTFELGVRHDGGDAETGFGADIGAGLSWVDSALGIEAELRARGLLTHESDGFRERGLAGSFTWDPTPDADRGPKFMLRQSLGALTTGGVAERLLRPDTAGSFAARHAGTGPGAVDDEAGRRMEARLGYGWPSFGGRYTTMPKVGIALTETAREYIHSWRLAQAKSAGLVFGVDVEGVRRESATGDAEPAHRLVLGLGWRLKGARPRDVGFELRLEGSRDAPVNDMRPENRVGLSLSARW